MAGTLEGKVAIVTGAGRGLGQVMTLGLLEAGACVAAVEIDEPALEETESAAEQRGAGERIHGVVADITRDDSAPKIVRAAMEHFGRLDILVNNAGINTGLLRPEGQPVGKFWEVTPTEFRRVIDVNVVAAFLMTRAALPIMLKQGWGRIINVTTSLDTMYRANMQPYGGSKAANEAHLLALAQELARAKLIPPEVMVAPLIWLCSSASDGVNGRRFIGALWDKTLPPEEAAKNAGAPMAWQQLGRQAIMPDRMC